MENGERVLRPAAWRKVLREGAPGGRRDAGASEAALESKGPRGLRRLRGGSEGGSRERGAPRRGRSRWRPEAAVSCRRGGGAPGEGAAERVGDLRVEAEDEGQRRRMRSPPSLHAHVALFIEGLSFRTTEESLRSAFERFGQLTEVNLVMDRVAKRPRGFAFLSYANEEESKNAMEGMHGKFLDGRVIFVEVAKRKV
uniref:PH01B001I13.24 protein n=1 Tax=Phyllostachys edulis TaxID=38705 RepID=L0P3R0_PHYED|nr:PH01B001I13.24 [Phyllostachys edulis]